EIAGLVEPVDEETGDELFGGVGEQHADLLVEMLAQGGPRGDILVDIGGFAGVGRPAAGPIGAEAVFAALFGKDVLDLGVETLSDPIGILNALPGLDGVVIGR